MKRFLQSFTNFRLRQVIPGMVAVFLLAGGAITNSPAQDFETEISKSQEKLERLKREAAKLRKEAGQLSKQEKNIIDRLTKDEQAINATRNYIRELEQREAILGDEMGRTEKRLQGAQKDLEGRKENLRNQLRTTYKRGKSRTFEVILSGTSFSNIVQRSVFMNRVLEQEKHNIAVVQEKQAEVKQALFDLEKQRLEVAQLQIEKTNESKRLKDLRSRRENDLTTVRSKRAQSEQAAAELDQAAERLQGVLAELERKRKESLRRNDPILTKLDRENFARNKGVLPWPVQGEVISSFGRHEHPKYKTITLNNGIDIAAAHGSAVGAVGDGVVDLVKWLPGYGQSVIINHGRGYYSIYAHLSATHVAEGDVVEPGEVVGSVGDTGSLKGTCLHFEIRSGSEAENPEVWLRP
ncbi:MAG: peptidoglycan DD-metalloendopeptidase family protein [Candidatus Eisenbacteria bacterium]|uniref:Peptidoglycan DD-metalloendopeptidase family protein n=1 Tax=Eiseniibacteriota bacterium TaxID=2212470 RepID=A0A7Y2EF96_UNCEI|nr:peptidoglycan DD-metalloendopeptidase family protein [Candidatus Eisenbacteria bacterium]